MPKPSIGATARPSGMGRKQKDTFHGSFGQTLETRLSNRRICGLTARGAAGERQECDIARTLDCYGNRALVSRAGSQLSPRLDLAALTDMAAQAGEILVIYVSNVIGAVLANLAARATKAAASAATWSTRATTALSAFTATALGTTEAAGARFSLFCVLRISHSYLPNFLFCAPRMALR